MLRSLLALLLGKSLARAQPKALQTRRPAPTLFPQMKALISLSPHLPSRVFPHVRPQRTNLQSAVLRSRQQFQSHRSLRNNSLL